MTQDTACMHLNGPDPPPFLERLRTPPCVSARSPASLVCPTAGPMGPTNTEGMEIVEDDELKRAGECVRKKAKEICSSKLVKDDVVVEVCEGDPRLVISCQAVEKHRATILVVGSHGYGALKRVVLGSVSDYHANCSVLIVKEPNQKHQ